MPSVSGPQHRAMEAAAHGTSNLGIPKSVGEEFSEADRGRHFKDADPTRAQVMKMIEDAAKQAKDYPAAAKAAVDALRQRWAHVLAKKDTEEPAEITGDPIMAKLDEIFDAAQVLSYRLGKLEAERSGE